MPGTCHRERARFAGTPARSLTSSSFAIEAQRDDGNSAIALLLNGRRFQFVVRLASGRHVSVTAPATAGSWTHVAAAYDNSYARLYLDGKEVAARHHAQARSE